MSVSGNNSAVCNKFRVCVLLVVSVVFSSFLAVVTAVEDRDEVNGLTLATNHSAIVLGEQLDVRLFRDGPSSLTLDAESVEITGRLVFTNASSSSSSSSTTTTKSTTTKSTTTSTACPDNINNVQTEAEIDDDSEKSTIDDVLLIWHVYRSSRSSTQKNRHHQQQQQGQTQNQKRTTSEETVKAYCLLTEPGDNLVLAEHCLEMLSKGLDLIVTEAIPTETKSKATTSAATTATTPEPIDGKHPHSSTTTTTTTTPHTNNNNSNNDDNDNDAMLVHCVVGFRYCYNGKQLLYSGTSTD